MLLRYFERETRVSMPVCLCIIFRDRSSNDGGTSDLVQAIIVKQVWSMAMYESTSIKVNVR